MYSFLIAVTALEKEPCTNPPDAGPQTNKLVLSNEKHVEPWMERHKVKKG
jgi:hypothetical protein